MNELWFDLIIMDEKRKKLGLQTKIDLDISIYCDRPEPENLQLCMRKQ